MKFFFEGYVEKTLTHTSEISTQAITKPTSETGSQTTLQEPNDDTQMEESNHPSTPTRK